jgi:hypothetical protein
MSPTGNPWELASPPIREFGMRDESETDRSVERTDSTPDEDEAEWEELFDENALSLRADGRERRYDDDDDDSDLGFDDFDDDSDEDDDLDDDYDDDEEEFDDDFDETDDDPDEP